MPKSQALSAPASDSAPAGAEPFLQLWQLWAMSGAEALRAADEALALWVQSSRAWNEAFLDLSAPLADAAVRAMFGWAELGDEVTSMHLRDAGVTQPLLSDA